VETEFEVPVAGGTLRGWRSGAGPDVVLLHGGPGLSDYTASLAAELQDSYTVHRYQQRGLAPSTTAGPFDIETHVADALAVVHGAGPDGAVVVGHSWGAHLAMHVAVTGDPSVRAMVVVDPLGAVGDGGEADLERILAERTPATAAARAEELDRRAMAGDGTAHDMAEGLELVWPAYFADPAKAPPMPPLAVSVACYAGTWESIHAHLARHTLETRLPHLDIPAVFVMAAQSPIPPRHGTATAALVKGARAEVVDGCGHFLWLEQPGVVRRALDSLAG
jgi:proline iminopeptidase